ncbi:MAG: hypothetical protein MZV65_34225 [Chromatiales bacterium]|nr:hypothetical protein [Chromatiales bacterium]
MTVLDLLIFARWRLLRRRRRAARVRCASRCRSLTRLAARSWLRLAVRGRGRHLARRIALTGSCAGCWPLSRIVVMLLRVLVAGGCSWLRMIDCRSSAPLGSTGVLGARVRTRCAARSSSVGHGAARRADGSLPRRGLAGAIRSCVPVGSSRAGRAILRMATRRPLPASSATARITFQGRRC